MKIFKESPNAASYANKIAKEFSDTGLEEKYIKAASLAISSKLDGILNEVPVDSDSLVKKVENVKEVLKKDLRWNKEGDKKELIKLSLKFGDLYEYKLGSEKSAQRILDKYDMERPGDFNKFCALQKQILEKCREDVLNYCLETYGERGSSSPSVGGSSGDLADRSSSATGSGRD